jgi:hypothetical protein
MVDPSWLLNGQAVCLAPQDQYPSSMVTDGKGGAFIAIMSVAGSVNGTILYHIYVQHITQQGTIASGWPVGGVPVCTANGFRYEGGMVPDGSGGVFIAWEDKRSDWNVYVQHVSDEGQLAPGWPVDGLAVCAAPGEQREPSIVSDGSNGAYVLWTDEATYPISISAQRVTYSGEVAAGWPTGGKTVSHNVGHQLQVRAIMDGAGGFFAAWVDGIGTSRVRIQRFAPDGSPSPGWPVEAVPIGTTPGTRWDTRCMSDDPSRVWVVWEQMTDVGSNDSDVYLSLITQGSIDPRWPSEGLRVASGTGHQDHSALMSDELGGAYVGWNDAAQSPNWRARIARITENATWAAGWSDQTTDLSVRPPTQQYWPSLVPAGGGAVIAAWPEYGDGGARVFAQRIGPGPPPVPRLGLIDLQARAGKVLIRSHAENWVDSVIVYRSHDETSWTEVASISPASGGALEYEDVNVAPGDHWSYRLGIRPSTFELYSDVARIDLPWGRPSGPKGWILATYPNPSTRFIRMRAILPTPSVPRTEIFSVSGRRMEAETRVLSIRANEISYEIDVSHLPNGVYMLRYIGNGGTPDEARRVVITR